MTSMTHYFVGFCVISVADPYSIFNVFFKFHNLFFMGSVFCLSVSYPAVPLNMLTG